MISRDYSIIDQHGMHARPATALLKLARQFSSEISMEKNEKTIQMKSMLNILALALKYGETVIVIIEGEDEEEAAAALDIFFKEDMKNF
jgi:phosphotransferase system HPr (HPr) family protein